MNIIVCIKQVPDTSEIKIDPVNGTLIREGVPSIINPDDKIGLEMALRLKDTHKAHVTVISMGPLQADRALREALAMGADKAILLTDRKFAGADTLATSHALAGALKKLQFDLIITGRQAIDGDTAQVGPQIAEHLDLPQISYVEKIEFDQNNTFNVRRAIEDGYEILEVESPCLVTVVASDLDVRYMSVKGIMYAYQSEIEYWGANNIEVNEEHLGLKGSPTRVHKAFSRGIKAAGELYELDTEEAVGMILSKLKEKFIIN